MAKIPLRLYDREIENLIDRGQIEEAIAHCKHILQIYPKHIDTYRLLGKAYLESQRFGDAADIFQRVLSVIPDDFVSQVGMSIIREDEGKLDSAIWHMERAFEVQSANSAVQEELKRLYSRRDGVEPPKVRLTRGALVRMYARGDLYQQAIAEIRSALAEDPQRADMQVLLARMYALAGMKVEAAEVCSNLLKLYPFCLEANRILAEILPSTNRSEDSDIYRQRIIALDPYYAAFTLETASLNDLPDNAVTLERLEWDPMQELGLTQPRWADTLGVKLEDEPASQIPDWLMADTVTPSAEPTFLEQLDLLVQPAAPPVQEESQALTEEPQVEAIPPAALEPDLPADLPVSLPATKAEPLIDLPAPEPEAEIPSPSDDLGLIPDWMKEAGWMTSDKNMDGLEAALSMSRDEGEETDEEEGLEELAPAEIPDWLLAMAPSDLPEKKEEATSTAGLVEALENRFGPERLQDGGEGAVEIPDWLTPVINDQEPSEVPSTVSSADGQAEMEELDLDSLFAEAGLDERPAYETRPSAELEIPGGDGQLPAPAAAEKDEALAWLEGLAAKQGAPEDTLTTRPEDRPDQPPAWVQDGELSLEMPEQAVASVDGLETEAVGEGDRAVDELPSWLQTVQLDGETQEPAAGELSPEEKPELPGWLQQLESEEQPEAMAGEILAAPEAALEAALEVATEGAETEEVPDWLSSFAVSQEPVVSQEPDIEPVLASELPAWLVELKATDETLVEDEISQQAWIGHDELPVEFSPADLTAMGLSALAFDEQDAAGVDQTGTGLQMDEQALTADQPSIEPSGDVISPLEAALLPTFSLADDFEEPSPQADLPTMDTTPEEAVQRAADWIQELNPDDEAKPAEGELPISEWTPPQDYELPAELADLVASIEKERAAMEAAGSQSEPLSGPALNVPIEMDQEATQAWLAQMATVHTSEAKTVALRGKGPIQNPPKWVEDGKAPPTSSLPGATAQPASAEEELPSWLRNLEDEDLIPEAAKAKAIEPPTDQLPSWLQGLEDGEITAPSADEESADQDAEIPTPADTGPLSEIPEIKIYETPEEILEVSQQSTEQYEPLIAEWLDQIKEIEVEESASEISPVEIEEAPIASAVEEDIAWAFEPAPEEANQPVLHVEETMAVEDLELTAPPQKPTDPQLVEAMFTSPEPPLAEVESLSPEPAPPTVLPEAVLPETVLPETVSIPPLPSQLSAAQNQLWRGDIDQALADYGIMVRSGLCLEEIIQDMRAALYQHPIHIGIWETLGDAYARNHCLQDALDAYTKAEELIR